MKLKRIIAIACTAAMTVSLISGCGGASDKDAEETEAILLASKANSNSRETK